MNSRRCWKKRENLSGGDIRKDSWKSQKATKNLTEFALKNGQKLRIYVIFWGDKEYAQRLGYYGNTVYKPVLINENGSQRIVYKGSKGLPKLEELRKIYDDWSTKLATGRDRERLKEVVRILYELAQTDIYFDERQAHLVYQLLRIAKEGPIFRIIKPKDVEKLDAEMQPAIVVSFRGFKAFSLIKEYCYGTKMYDAHKIMNEYKDEFDRIINELRESLSNLAGAKGPTINLDDLVDYVSGQMQKVFRKEANQHLS